MTPSPFIFLWLHTINHNSRIEYLVKESSTSDQLETNKKAHVYYYTGHYINTLNS